MPNFRIIYTDPATGSLAVIIPAPGVTEADAAKAVPAGVQFEIVDKAEIPADRTFRDAWRRAGRAVEHDMVKAKNIAHEKRRAARSAEFAPLDIEATIPAKAAQAENKRAAVRAKYDALQAEIDAAADVAALKATIAPVL